MSFWIKTLSLGAILGVVFTFFLFFGSFSNVFAISQNNWQRIPLNQLEFNWFTENPYPSWQSLDNFTATSSEGYRFWDIQANGSGLWRLEATTTWQEIPSISFHWWIFGDLQGSTCENNLKFGYEWKTATTSGWTTGIYGITQNVFSAGDKTITSCYLPEVFNEPQIISVRYLTFSTDTANTPDIFLMIYTDENFPYLIDTKQEFYVYLGSAWIYWVQLPTPEGFQEFITLPEGTCDDLGTIAGALCRVITHLFYPSQTSLTQFSNLKNIIADKPPFGYFTSIKGYLGNLKSTSTPAFELTAQIENIDIFGTLKTGLAWILWIFFGFWVIKRIARFEF